MTQPELTFVPDVEFHVEGMDCANCALTLERGVKQLTGVDDVQVNFAAATLTARGAVTADAIAARVRALGYGVMTQQEALAEARRQSTESAGRPRGFLGYLITTRQTRLGLVAAILLLASLPVGWVLSGPAAGWARLALHLGAIGLAGWPIVRQGVQSLLVARQVTIDLLMAVATVGALAIGETGEAATVIVLFAVGEALEGFSAERARDSLRSLLTLAPERATVLRPCQECAEHIGQQTEDGGVYEGGACPFCGVHEAEVPVEQVAVGERVVIRPGERIPVDGRVLVGASSVNQAPVTGESLPVLREVGDEVFAGTVNGEGALEIEATRIAGDSTISRIVRLVEQAQAQRSAAERFIDRFAKWYTPAVVGAAALVAFGPPLVAGAPLVVPGNPTAGWLYRGLALLIVACPCALVISTPVTVVSTLTRLAREGVLVKGGVYLDALARVKVFAFDKTGTLTAGEPVVAEAQTLACPPDVEACDACDELLAVAAAVERRSEHPLGRAVVQAAAARGLLDRHPAAEDVQVIAGRGVEGTLRGRRVTVGSHRYLHDRGVACEGLHEQVSAAERNGRTVLLVSRGGVVDGYITVADPARAQSAEALRHLKDANPDLRTVMLTGDNPAVAETVAAGIGAIDEVRAGLLPEDKVEAVRELQAAHGPVAMVGDGVNDAPALALASVGVAMGGAGTAQAMETADVVLMQDDLTRLPDGYRASLRAKRIIRQNIAFSLAIKALFLALTLPGLATMWMAVFADMGASLLVTLNGMRMLRANRR